MMQRVLDFPFQLFTTSEFIKRQESKLYPLDAHRNNISRVIILGMGGSGIVGDFIRVLLRKSGVSVHVYKKFTTPSFAIDEKSLVIAVTYSGKTSETLNSLTRIMSKGKDTNLAVVTSSSELSTFCSKENIPCIQIPANGYSRASLGNMLLPVLMILQRVNLLNKVEYDISEAISVAKAINKENNPTQPIHENPARLLAESMINKVPVIYGTIDSTDAVALRWKQQLNENAKTFCHCDYFPELLHNEIEMWNYETISNHDSIFSEDDGNTLESQRPLHSGFGKNQAANNSSPYCVVLLRDASFERESQTGETIEAAKNLIENTGSEIVELYAKGDSELSRLLSLSHFGDFVSVYLASLKGIDPSKIPNIESLKSGTNVVSPNKVSSSEQTLPIHLEKEAAPVSSSDDQRSGN